MISSIMKDGTGCSSEILATAYQAALCICTTMKTSISFFSTTDISYFPYCEIGGSQSSTDKA